MISARINNRIRKAVYRRDHYRCALCDSPRFIQVHHVIPKGSGGSVTSMHNWTPKDVALACVEYVADIYAPDWWPYDALDVDTLLDGG